jgi:hypothetical protein
MEWNHVRIKCRAMIKYLCLALLIGLSGAAYALTGASPLVDIANTITASSGQPTPPAQATVAGFTTCVVCMDFTASTGGVWVNGSAVAGVNAAQTNTWLDCAGASSPIWFQGTNGSPLAGPCPTIAADAVGNPQVLLMHSPPLGASNTINGIKLYNNGTGVGIMAPTANYLEATYSVPQFPSKGYIQGAWTGGAGEIPNNVHNYLEVDDDEVNTNLNCGAFASGFGSWWNGHWDLGNNWSGTCPPNNDSFNLSSQYLKIGARVTTDGTTVFKCMWINDVFQNCIQDTVNGTSLSSFQLADATSRMQTYLALTGCLASAGGCPTTSDMNAYTKSFYMWSCSGWKTTACHSSSPDPGGF